MKGYWNKPEESAACLRKDASGRIWFYTGDIARIDEDGYSYIVQRKKDMIIVDGYNVPVGRRIGALRAPGGAAGRGDRIPDAYHGEIVKACIALAGWRRPPTRSSPTAARG
jgi:long-chain acyl-CoA synthetase